MLYVFRMNPAPSYTFGYARVSTEDQNLALQLAALRKHGIPDDQIYREKASGSTMVRKELAKVLKILREGDTLVVWKLDRLGRTVLGVLEVIAKMDKDGVSFISLTDSIDTTTPIGKAVLHIMATMAQLERDMISERTKAGMAVAKAQGAVFGKPHYIKDYPKRLACFEEMFREPDFDGMKVRQIVDRLNAADRKAPQIESLETYRKWKRQKWPGAMLKDAPLPEPE